jgi:hypothetical protein
MATVLERPPVSHALPAEKVKGKQSAVAIPKGGYFPDRLEQGRFGPAFPRTPINYGFMIIAKIIPGTEEKFYEHARRMEKAVAEDPEVLAVLALHSLKWALFEIDGSTCLIYSGIFDTDFDKYTEDAVSIFSATGLDTVFENLQGFPRDWKTNPEAFVQFVRDHHRPSFMEYSEFSYVSSKEIKRALAVRDSLGNALDNMQL